MLPRRRVMNVKLCPKKKVELSGKKEEKLE
jgi:hypothetical protein